MFVEQKDIKEQKSSILCPLCGIKFTPNQNNICPTCSMAQVGSGTLLSVSQEQKICTYCNRYQRPPWVHCEAESANLLAVLLKKVKGLNKVEIKDAKFVWTEPHSRRLKVKIEFLRTEDGGNRVVQSQVVEFVEKYVQCGDCKKKFTAHDWNVLLQIRQHSQNKRSLLALQQNLIRQKFNEKMLRSQAIDKGMDLYFRNEQDANQCLNYIKAHMPVTYKTSKQMVSHNEQSNTSNVKTTHALIIPSICKDDLLLIHPKWTKQLGYCSPLLLCTKVASQLYFLDPTNFRKVVITPTHFTALEPYGDIFPLKHRAENYIVLDNEGVRSAQTHNQYGAWGLVVAKDGEMKEIFMKSHINAEVGQEFQGVSLQDWMYIKNMPQRLLVKKIRSEEEIQRRKQRKGQKRRQKRQQKKEQQSKMQSQIDHEQPPNKDQLEWVQASDSDESDN